MKYRCKKDNSVNQKVIESLADKLYREQRQTPTETSSIRTHIANCPECQFRFFIYSAKLALNEK